MCAFYIRADKHSVFIFVHLPAVAQETQTFLYGQSLSLYGLWAYHFNIHRPAVPGYSCKANDLTQAWVD